MRVDKKLVRLLFPFAPLAVIFAAILLLGTVFLRSYDTGPTPQSYGNGLYIASPTILEGEESQAIAERMTVPAKLPPVETHPTTSPVSNTRVRDASPSQASSKDLPERSHAKEALSDVANRVQGAAEDPKQTVEDAVKPPVEIAQGATGLAPHSLD